MGMQSRVPESIYMTYETQPKLQLGSEYTRGDGGSS
jgi:hypothetical protein